MLAGGEIRDDRRVEGWWLCCDYVYSFPCVDNETNTKSCFAQESRDFAFVLIVVVWYKVLFFVESRARYRVESFFLYESVIPFALHL